MAHGDEVGRVFGGLDASYLRDGQHVALFKFAPEDRVKGVRA
ncbi:hypothetical protein SDC9_170470 [bioreactor metagenome]|uniref:Uncharacterized protein n=1 Tax=bioreactor metagenome TaxID=1076179 RepID=A0A645G8W6_9ZZZZ